MLLTVCFPPLLEVCSGPSPYHLTVTLLHTFTQVRKCTWLFQEENLHAAHIRLLVPFPSQSALQFDLVCLRLAAGGEEGISKSGRGRARQGKTTRKGEEGVGSRTRHVCLTNSTSVATASARDVATNRNQQQANRGHANSGDGGSLAAWVSSRMESWSRCIGRATGPVSAFQGLAGWVYSYLVLDDRKATDDDDYDDDEKTRTALFAL